MENETSELIPCNGCGRNFRPEAHAKHVGICKKVFQDKRKVYNTTEHRLPDAADAPELAEVRRRAALATKKGEVGIGDTSKDKKDKKEVKNNWRIKSEQFRAAMKDAQIVKQFQKEGRPMSELPPPRATNPELDDRTQCPHCGRKFAQQAAERHIPACAKTKAKAKPPPGQRPPGVPAPAPAAAKAKAKAGARR